MLNKVVVLGLVGVTACAVDSLEDTSEVTSEVTSANRLSANRLSANRLSANRLSANRLSAAALQTATLAQTDDGRDVLTYIVSCALPAGSAINLTVGGIPYTFPGSIGLAPNWATNIPTVAERHWVTACVLARTNLYGVSVQLSLRGNHPALATNQAELTEFTLIEGGFYGDLFDPAGSKLYACESKLTSKAPTYSTFPLRACTLPSGDGTTTQCGFIYSGLCDSSDQLGGKACSSAKPLTACRAGYDEAAPHWNEVVTAVLVDK